MKFKDEEAYKKGFAAQNGEAYGEQCFTYARDWADLMEARMAKGEKLEAVAKECSHQADTDGITGFMYGVAVSILSKCWEHGDALRQWHNLDTQIGTEGEEANRKGTTLNPALVNIA